MVSKICPAVSVEVVAVGELAGQQVAGPWPDDTAGSAPVGTIVQHLGSLDGHDLNDEFVADPDVTGFEAWAGSPG